MTGPYTAVLGGTYAIGPTQITCPTCEAERGLSFTAFPQDPTAVITCPNRHTWDEPRVTGENVEDLYRALAGQPTRNSNVTLSGKPVPREPCGTCKRFKYRIDYQCRRLHELYETDVDEHARVQERWLKEMADWASHLAEHCTAKDTP